MFPRRRFLIGAGQLAVASALVGCRGSDATSAPARTAPAPTSPAPTGTAATPDTTLPSVSSTTATTAAATTAPTVSSTTAATAASTTIVADRSAWAGADFGGLDEYLAGVNTDAFMIVERGATIHEWARPGAKPARDIASAEKSVLALLVGRAVADGHFSIDTVVDDVLGTGWTPHGRSADITVRHLLTMTSGLDDSYALIAPPGTTWIYSAAYASLFDVLTTTTGRPLGDVAGEWLFGPAGATTARFYRRPQGDYAPIGLIAGAADLAAIGQMVLGGTQPNLPTGWLTECFTSSQQWNLAYGRLWWLNGMASYGLPGLQRAPIDGPLIPGAPGDLVAALGKDDQKLYISRDLQLVVARLGGKADQTGAAARSSFDVDLWGRLEALRNPN